MTAFWNNSEPPDFGLRKTRRADTPHDKPRVTRYRRVCQDFKVAMKIFYWKSATVSPEFHLNARPGPDISQE